MSPERDVTYVSGRSSRNSQAPNFGEKASSEVSKSEHWWCGLVKLAPMAQVSASLDDRRAWGRALRSYQGAFGTGRLDDEPERDGRLTGFILTERERIKAIWKELGLSTDTPASAWHLLDQSEDFKIVLDAVKLSRFLIVRYWTCRISFFFSHQGQMRQVTNAAWFGAPTIADLFLIVDRVFHRFERPAPMPEFAQRQLR